MSSKELKDLVLPSTEGTLIEEWLPEEFGFVSKDKHRNTFYRGRYELRRMQYNNWLLRKKVTNARGNTEMLVKWGMVVIEPKEVEFAKLMFTLGLR